MGLPKGRTNNLKGRPKGSKNRSGKDLLESLNEIIADNLDSFKNDVADLPSQERINVMLRLFDFVVPKTQSLVATESNGQESST